MKKRITGIIASLAVLSAIGVSAGDLTPPGPPGPTMKTLQEVYEKQDATHQLVEAFVYPQTLSDTTTVVNAGYYAATNLTQVDTDLVAGNIKTNVTLFGIMGMFEGSNVVSHSAAVPITGQTTSYAIGDDGDLEMGLEWPIPRFTDNADGTVTDNLTDLIWLKNASAFGQRNWATALNDCATLNSGEAGLSDGSVEGDWRLPNLRELLSLIDYSQSNPVLPSGHPFTGVQTSLYWSSSTFVDYPGNAYYVVLVYGDVNGSNKTSTYFVWPVRGGP